MGTPINMYENNKTNIVQKNNLLIIGASGHGKVVADIAIKMKRWKTIHFLDDDESKIMSMGLKVIGNSYDAFKYINHADLFVAVGDNIARERLQEKLSAKGASIPVLIHPDAVIGEQVELGIGTVIMAGVVINCCTKIGNGCIINTAASIDHDNIIGDYVHISPGVHTAGTVKIGKNTWIGVGTVISNNINITENCIIGAGAVVVRSIPEIGTYVGVPAIKLKGE